MSIAVIFKQFCEEKVGKLYNEAKTIISFLASTPDKQSTEYGAHC